MIMKIWNAPIVELPLSITALITARIAVNFGRIVSVMISPVPSVVSIKGTAITARQEALLFVCAKGA